jgi:hypothetical protein
LRFIVSGCINSNISRALNNKEGCAVVKEQIGGRPGLKMKIQLTRLAHARSGDKGDTANVGLIALRDEYYPLLLREVTAARVRQHFAGICKGEVERFELPNLHALNFLLHESLGGGGTLSLMTDAQGKTFSTALLRMFIEVSDDEAGELKISDG